MYQQIQRKWRNKFIRCLLKLEWDMLYKKGVLQKALYLFFALMRHASDCNGYC
jgi:hypothetical protein